MSAIRPWTARAGLVASWLLALAAAANDPIPVMNPIESILRGHEQLTPIVAESERYRLQVVLGLVEPDELGKLRLLQHSYRADAEYFYPASSIKLCAAVAALEELRVVAAETGLPIDENTQLVYHPLFEDEGMEDADPTNLDDGKITVGHELRKLFLVSDNDSFNRFYELVGQDGVNRSMRRAGLSTAHIVHRLSERRTAAENRMSPRIEMIGRNFRHQLPRRVQAEGGVPAPIQGLLIGRGFWQDGELRKEPMDFSVKNRMSLVDLQRALCKVVRPDVDAGGAPFRLADRQRTMMMVAMRQYPRQSLNPLYPSEEYPDHYVKFLLPGLQRMAPKQRFEIYNKIGRAYGFSTENAYVVDTETGRDFFLAATMYTNSDGVLDDDRYEYEEIADPFLADLAFAVAMTLLDGSEPQTQAE